MQVPRRNRRRTDQHARVSGKQGSEECGAEYEDSGSDSNQLTYRSAENVMEVQFHCDQTGSGAGAEVEHGVCDLPCAGREVDAERQSRRAGLPGLLQPGAP